ncbi:MAG: translation initiation factor IF-2, partial [Mitsuokella jalaludinii]|nr:translation initiation factor IF-2 [Mitsuokella jalaludinii]
MSKYRVYELAKEFNTDSKVILDILKRNKFKAANNFSSVGEEERTAIKNSLNNKGAKPQAKAPAAQPAQKPTAKPAEKRAEKPQAAKPNHSGSNSNSGNNGNNSRHDRRSDAGRNNSNSGNAGSHGNSRAAASSSNRPSHTNGGNSNNGGNRNGNGGGSNNRGGNRNDRRNGGSRNERGGRNDRTNRFGGNRNDRNNRRGRNNKRGGQQAPKVEIAHPKHIKLPETIAVKDLASKMSYTAAEVVKKLFMMGVMATINQEIDFDTAALVASEFGVTCEELPPEVDPTEIPEIEDDPKSLKLRPPVVTVMGHVDHGKTSLLDCIRNTHVQTHEAGGITQHIGAYQVNCKGKKIVFLDTPGHEAFTAMRARGAQITDIAILVVAADDGVMPQTIEAIHHAKSAGVPIIVAINKIDKPGANPDRVKQELMEQGLVPEEYGGDTIMVPVSAKKQIGIDDLLEMVLLVAEVKELKANPNRDARGVIVEAKLDKGRGPVATVLVQNGTLRIGDSVVCGTTYGKVRAMVNDRGENVKKAGPSVPVEILGLNDVPEAGDILAVLEEKQARSIAEARIERQRNNLIKSKKVSLDDLFHQIQEGDIKDLNIVIKADVQGSVEALSSSLLKLNKNDEVRVSIVHSGVGAVNESDVMLASASNALIIAFNVRPDANARKLADTENIDIRTYRVIYDAINDVKDAMSGMLKPKYKEVVQGRVEIRQVMKFSKALVAGSYVLEGKICNNS